MQRSKIWRTLSCSSSSSSRPLVSCTRITWFTCARLSTLPSRLKLWRLRIEVKIVKNILLVGLLGIVSKIYKSKVLECFNWQVIWCLTCRSATTTTKTTTAGGRAPQRSRCPSSRNCTSRGAPNPTSTIRRTTPSTIRCTSGLFGN